MNIPESVQIGPYRYEIIASTEALVRRRADRENSSIWAWTDRQEQRIWLDPALARDLLAECLLHEILHGVYLTSGASHREVTEEGAIHALTPILLDTLRRNPEVTAFLMEAVG